MKKTYTKPQMIFDSFAVTANIASCASEANLQQGDCPAYIAGMPVFTTDASGCRIKAQDGYHGICYYVPTADSNVFGS